MKQKVMCGWGVTGLERDREALSCFSQRHCTSKQPVRETAGDREREKWREAKEEERPDHSGQIEMEGTDRPELLKEQMGMDATDGEWFWAFRSLARESGRGAGCVNWCEKLPL